MTGPAQRRTCHIHAENRDFSGMKGRAGTLRSHYGERPPRSSRMTHNSDQARSAFDNGTPDRHAVGRMWQPPVNDGVTTQSRYVDFSREDWARLRSNTPLTLSDADLLALRGLNDVLDMREVVDIYLPLSRLLSLYVQATRGLHQVTSRFLGAATVRVPFVIGLAGSVAVGKSTTSRILRALLAHWPDHPAVDLVTTDGFLFPNAVLEARGLMKRKGFPESYDRARLVRFLQRREIRRPRSPRAGLFTPDLRHRPRDDTIRSRARHRHRRRFERAAGAAAGIGRTVVRVGLLRLLDLRRRGGRGHRAVVRRALPEAARHGVPGSDVLLPSLRVADRKRKRVRRRRASGTRSTG